MINYFKVGMASLTLAVISGCSIGQSESSCSAGDGNALCGSTRAIYKATNGEVVENDNLTLIKDGKRISVNANDLGALNGDHNANNENNVNDQNNTSSNQYTVKVVDGKRKLVAIDNSTIKANEPKADKEGNNLVKTAYQTKKMPYSFNYDGEAVRSSTKVMRIWVAPWVDASDDLHLSTLIYTDIEKRKWSVVAANEEKYNSSIRPYLKSAEKVIDDSTAEEEEKTASAKNKRSNK